MIFYPEGVLKLNLIKSHLANFPPYLSTGHKSEMVPDSLVMLGFDTDRERESEKEPD